MNKFYIEIKERVSGGKEYKITPVTENKIISGLRIPARKTLEEVKKEIKYFFNVENVELIEK